MNISFQDQFYVTFIMMEKQSCFRAGQVCKILLSSQAPIHDFRVLMLGPATAKYLSEEGCPISNYL